MQKRGGEGADIVKILLTAAPRPLCWEALVNFACLIISGCEHKRPLLKLFGTTCP